jgi:hypothetical protein
MDVTTKIAAPAEVNGAAHPENLAMWIYLFFFMSRIPENMWVTAHVRVFPVWWMDCCQH